MDAELPPQNFEPEDQEIHHEQDATPEHSVSLSLGHTASLLVDGRRLNNEDDPEALRQALTQNKEQVEAAFYRALEHFKSFSHHQGATINLPPLAVVLLSDKTGKDDKNVLTELGSQTNTYVLRDINEIKEEFHPMWHAVEQGGFLPEVRIAGGRSGRSAMLFIQPPEELET